MCLDVQADCLSLSVHFILCLLNFRWLSKTANKRTNWCQLQGFPQRNWNEPARSFHTRDSSSIPPFNEGWSATLMLFYIKTQSLICLRWYLIWNWINILYYWHWDSRFPRIRIWCQYSQYYHLCKDTAYRFIRNKNTIFEIFLKCYSWQSFFRNCKNNTSCLL